MKKFISFILSISLTFSMLFCSIPVHASGGGGVARTEDGICKFYHEDGTEIPASQYTTTQNYFKKLVEFQFPQIQIAKWLFGIIPNSQLESGFQDSVYLSNYLNKYGITGVDSWQEYCKNNYTYNGTDDSVSVSADASDDLHDALKAYLDANTPFIEFPTHKTSFFPAGKFDNKVYYNTFCDSINNGLSTDIYYITTNGNGYAQYLYKFSMPLFYANESSFDTSPTSHHTIGAINSDWIDIAYGNMSIVLDSAIAEKALTSYFYVGPSSYSDCLYSKNGFSVRIFRSIEAAKAYNVNQQPYYTTSKWTNYVSGQGNTITQQEFNAPVTYQDIVNNISGDTTINNGISPEQLEQIIDAIIEAMKGNSGSGGSGGSGSGDSGGSGGGSSGGGLSDLLSGLGALGDVILSILGKLAEYLGKAMALFGDVVLGIIDKVPKGFTDLLSAFFPFIPEEWTTAIGLGIVLTIILGIVRIFKK